MKYLVLAFVLLMIVAAVPVNAVPTENEYGNVKAWFNSQEATVKNVKLKIGEPAEIKVTVTSNINGNIYVKLTNPLVTEPYEVIEGTSIGKRIDNIDVSLGWSKTFSWKIKPNGAWTNGNAPINIFVEFSKIKDDKKIEFTIADPYILDEQYAGAAPSQKTEKNESGETAQQSGLSEPYKYTVAGGIILIVLVILVLHRKNNLVK